MSLLPSEDIVFEQGWRMFAPVPLELDLNNKYGGQIKPTIETKPRKENIEKENKIPSMPASSKMSQATSPKMKTESDSNHSNQNSAKYNNTARNHYDFGLNEKKAAAVFIKSQFLCFNFF